MGFFRKWRQRERDSVEKEERYDMEMAMAAISARLRFLEVLTSELVAELPPTKRDRILVQVREVVGELQNFPPAVGVPRDKEKDFHDELRRVTKIFIEKTTDLKPRPINR